MDRRQFVAGASVGIAAAASTFPKPAIAQGVHELKMVTIWPKTLPGLQSAAERVAQSITALSGGRLQVKVFAAGQMVGAFESFEAVSSGLADMYHASEITWAGRSAAFSYFCNVPFGFTPNEINAWIYHGGGQALWDELSAGFDLKPFMCGNTGPQMGGWFTKELTSVESYKGLRYRMPGIGGDVLRRLGAVVVNVPPGEIIASLKSGAIDASEFAGPWVDMAVGLHKAAKYYYYPGFHEPGAALSLVVNKKLWDGFGSAERSIIETAAAAENANSYAEFTANDAVALQQLAADPAIQIRKLDDSILQALGKLSGEVLFETGRKDDLTRRVYESFIKFRTASVRWGDISERAFLNARALSYPFGDDGRVGIGVVGGKAAAMSLVSSSPSAKTHSPKVREWAPLRLGVASRLLLAFLGISGLAVVGAGVAILSFRDISDVLDSITARRVPAALALQEVSRQAERIASAAPALLAAATPADHAESSRKIAVEMRELAQLLEGLEHRGADDVALGSMRSAVSHLRVNLESLDKLVADRMVVSELKRGQLRNALFAHSESQSLLTPWLQIIEGEIAQSSRVVADAGLGADERAAAGSRLVGSTASYHALQRVQFLITSVSDRLQQIAATEDVDSVRVQVFRIQQSLREAREMMASLDSRLQPLLTGKLEEFRAKVEGISSIPELRLQELGVVAQAQRHLTENTALSRDLTQAADRLVSVAKRDIAQANEEARSVEKFSSAVLIAAVALSLLSSVLIVWLYVGRNIVSRLTALSRSMLAISEGNLAANVPTGGGDEIAEMGRVVEALRKNTFERDELLIERAQAADRLEKQVEGRTAELAQSVKELRALGEVSQAVNSTIDLQTVLSTIIAKAVELSGTEAGTIYVFDEASEEFQVHASYGMDEALIAAVKDRRIRLGETMVSQAALQRRSMQLADSKQDTSSLVLDVIQRAGFRALLTIPLLGIDRIVGAMVVRRKEPGEFPKNTVDLLETFGAQSVLAIQNARLFESVEARTRELAKSLESLRAAQDRLVQTEKLASLGQLTAGIAHEIKNPLNFVNNFSAVSVELIDELREALDGVALDDGRRGEINELADMLQGNLDKIVQHGKRADSIVKNMLLHSRQGSGEHRPVDINALVEESLDLAYHGARAEKQGFNITLERAFDPAAGEVHLFPQEITRVLLNLISNGFYAATKRKAEVNGGDYEPTLSAATRSLGEGVEIRIRDNGTGIPAEVKEKMFNPFFTTKPAGEGTGLGLSLSHDIIVKQHGGSIEVDTKPGEFTEFRIILPREAATVTKSGERT